MARTLVFSILAPLVLGTIGIVTACGGGDTDGSGFDTGGSSGKTGAGDDGGETPGSSGGFGPGTGTADGGEGADECKKMDIVFVVDNSGSMEEEQTNLGANFPKFVSVIDSYRTKSGAELDYRIAVTTTDDVNQRGAFIKARGAGASKACQPGPTRPWVERPDGLVGDFFACRAQAGTNGNNIERPLESMLLAVTDRITDGTNTQGAQDPFVREDALLAFVVITDEDEGGTEDDPARSVDEYPALFDQVKGGERGKWATAVIAGEKQCNTNLGSAAEAQRLKQFVTATGDNAIFSSICVGDLTQGLKSALDTFNQACKNFPGPVK